MSLWLYISGEFLGEIPVTKNRRICYNELMSNRAVLVASLLATAIILIMLNFTTPAGLGPLGILLFFVLVYIVMYGVAMLVLKMFRKALGRKGFSRKSYLYTAVLAFAPIMLLLAQSLGSLTWFTLILVVLFEFLGCFLVYKRV